MISLPKMEDIRGLKAQLAQWVRTTPILELRPLIRSSASFADAVIFLKLESLQVTGSFKARAAFAHLLAMSPEERIKGVVTVSGGNHGVALSYSAQAFGVTCKVVMARSASPFRMSLCRKLGATVILCDTHEQAFEKVDEISRSEERKFVPPFDHPINIAATATLGLELLEQVGTLDTLVVPIGGGGLASGVALVAKTINPACKVIGVQSHSADAMVRSLDSGKPEQNWGSSVIADSLCPPHLSKLTLELCKQYLDRALTVTDAEISGAMKFLSEEYRLQVEGAGCAALAAVLGPLAREIKSERYAVINSGSNISLSQFAAITGLE